MARPVSKQPTELELEILKILWQLGACSGRQLRDALAAQRDLTYQSVMTILDIMEDKGYVRRKKVAGSFEYRAQITQPATAKRMMQDLVARLFGGSSRAAMLNLLETSDLSDSEIAQLRQIVQKPPEE
jgi:BlaI family penicillinase repressor